MVVREDFRPRALGSVLGELITEMGIGPKLDEARIIDAWFAVAGEYVKRNTTRTWIKKEGHLFVKVRSSAWRHELHMQRNLWRARINEEIGKDLVSKITFC